MRCFNTLRLKSILPNFNGISSSPAVVQALQQQLDEVQQAAEDSSDLQAEAQRLQQVNQDLQR